MDDLSNVTKRQEIEYATQFFGFPPDSLVDTLIGDATEIAKENLQVTLQNIDENTVKSRFY